MNYYYLIINYFILSIINIKVSSLYIILYNNYILKDMFCTNTYNILCKSFGINFKYHKNVHFIILIYNKYYLKLKMLYNIINNKTTFMKRIL